MVRRSVTLAALVAAMFTVLCAPAFCYLRIHPSNPHYFQETSTGKPVILTGYGSIVPSWATYDYTLDIDYYKARRMMDCRAWYLAGYGGGDGILAYGLSGSSGAYWGGVGGYKCDMNTWNPTYWTRLNDALAKCNAGGIYVPIMLFDRCWMSPPEDSRWGDNPWARDNNINNLEVPIATGEGVPAFYSWSSKPNLRNQQERWIRKVIDETIDDPNVWYEIENEHVYTSIGWADHYSQFVKDYIAANYPNSPRLVTHSSIESDADLDACFTMPGIDVVNKHYGTEPENLGPSIINTYLEARWSYNKAISVDEFANNVDNYNTLRQECWTVISSGGNFHMEDPLPPAKPYDIVENIRSFLALSGWDFIRAAPNKSLITSGGGYCMAQPGVEYFCYFPTGGSKTITLSAATYRAEWWNPRTGGFYNVSSFTHGGGGKSLSSPDSNDWVLHLTTQPAPTTSLQSKAAASAITIDGSSSDWNLADFNSRICGGDVGAGSMALVGYDANGICYSGGHWTGGQFPPANAADHTARVYSRNDASYLYFLVRCDDSDIRYPNAAASNYLNDCVEFYIDPGHDHGSTAISGSTSDFQLVVDANNQKNVYSTTTAYQAQVLAGVTSAVVRDASGWWLEVRIAKSATSPVIPASGTIGIDFNFRDNDGNNDAAQTTIYSWRDAEASATTPTKIPARWGDLSLQGTWDSLGNQLEIGNGATPGVAVDSQGNIHVVYMGGGNIYYRKINGSTMALGAVEQIPNPEGAGDYRCACVKCDASDVPHVAFQKGWAGECHRNWYSNRIGGSWKTPVKIIDNDILMLDGRANYPRMALYGSYAYVSSFGVPGEMNDGSEGTIVRVTNLSTTPVVDRTGYTPLWVPHPMITSDGRLYVSGRNSTQGYKYQEFNPTTLQAMGSMVLLTGGMDRYPGEENAACIDREDVIHAVGAYNTNQGGTWRGRIFYNSSDRAGASQPPIVGLEGTNTWDSIQVYPTIATDPELKVYISWWFDPTGEGRITMVNGSSFATPVTYASHVTEYMRWNPQIASTPTGGVYAAWDDVGRCYIRGIGVGSADIVVGTVGPVTNFTASPWAGRVMLAWKNPSEASFRGTMIRYKTTGYPTSATDGTLVTDKSGTAGASDTYNHTGLTNGVTYYYSAFAHDSQANYASKADAGATPAAGNTAATLNAKPAGAIIVDGSTSDWSLSDFTTVVRAGVDSSGDCAVTGFDNGGLYYAGYWTDGVRPANAADHTAKVYSRHDGFYVYFLIRCDDDQMNYSSPTGANWANDCVEFYIDPSHNHGAVGLTEPGTSASDIQLVIDANNQKNVYCCTAAYKNQVLAGVTSAVVRDATGWWLEARISKSALDPDIPASSGTLGIDFAFRDNDNNMDPATSSMYTWADNASGAAFPSKVPDRWGNLYLVLPPDVTPPSSVTSFAATRGDQQVTLSWHNPSDADFLGTMIRYKTTGYPTSATDGTLVIDKANSPNSNDSYVHTGLTNGVVHYYSAFAHDAIPNNATKADANATPADTTAPGPVTSFTVIQGDGRDFLQWTNPTAGDFAGVKVLFKTTGYPSSSSDGAVAYQGTGTSCTHDSLTNGTAYYYAAYAYDEVPNYSSPAAQANASPIHFGPVQAKMCANNTLLTLTAGVVSAVFGDSFYVQCVGADCGVCGIKVTKTGHGMQVGQSATVKGTILTDAATGERYISATWVNGTPPDPPLPRGGLGGVDPLGVTNRTLGGADWNYNSGTGAGQRGVLNGSGTNSIGLLVCVWGEVTQLDESGLAYVYIDDGSGLRDSTTTGGTANIGVRVKTNPTGYAAGSYVTLVGISSCFKDGSGNIRPQVIPRDTTPPGPVTSFVATPGAGQVSLTWANPGGADFAGTMIRFKTTGYPTGPTDGTQCYNGTGSSSTHTGLTNGTTYYYRAYAYDAADNYASPAQASATPISPPVVISNSAFDSTADSWSTSVWRSGPDFDPGAMAWVSGIGNPGGCMQSTGYGISDGADRCLREGGEISRVISTAGHSGVKVYYDLKVNSLGDNYTGSGAGTCVVDHNLVDEQLTVFYSTDGGTNWTEAGYLLRSALLASYQSFGTRTIDLTGVSACDNNASFALRFRWQFNQATDTGWLDNIKVQVNN